MTCRGLIFIVLMLIGSYLSSQNKQLLFGFNDIPQSVLINPSTKLDHDWFVGIPLLSHVHLGFGSSGISAFDLFADDGRDFNDKLGSVIFKLEANDFFMATQQLDVFSGGFAFGRGLEKDRYLSFGMYLETDIIAYHPKDYAILAYEGNAPNIGRPFDISDFNVSGEVISVWHVGVTKNVNEKFTVGARAKIYSSIFNVSSTNNNGTFITQEGQNNLLIHTFDIDFSYYSSGIKSLADDNNSDLSNDIKTLRRRLLFGGNLGLGLDFGFTYLPSEQWTIEASLLDLGFIRHSKDLDNYVVNGSYVYEGINPLFPEVPDGQTAEDYWNEVADNFEELFEIDTTATKYTTWRPTKLNAAVRYSFGKQISKECNCLAEDGGYLNAVGAQLFAIRRPKAPQIALTAYYYRRIFNGLQLKTTYTMDSFSFTNVGLGMSADLGPLNFYLLADNVLEYQNLAKSRSASVQFGLNLVFGTGQ